MTMEEKITTEIDKASNDVVIAVSQMNLAPETETLIKARFLPFFLEVKEWKDKADSLIVTSIMQTEEMKSAKEARLIVKKIRTSADKVRRDLKAESLAYGRAIEFIYGKIEEVLLPIENHLEQQETFKIRYEAKIKEDLRIKRNKELEVYSEYVPFGLDLSILSEEDFTKTFNGAKLQFEAKIESDKKAEAERIKREKAEKEAKAKQDAENEKIKKENEANAKKLKEAQAKLNAEKEAREKAERELKEKADKEARDKKEALEREEAEKKAKAKELREAQKAPDKVKLKKFIDSFVIPEQPSGLGSDALRVENEIIAKFEGFKKWCKEITDKM